MKIRHLTITAMLFVFIATGTASAIWPFSPKKSTSDYKMMFHCEKCGKDFEFKPPKGEDMFESMETGISKINCPLCGKKKCAVPMVRCPHPQCKKYYVSRRTEYEAKRMRGEKVGEEPKDICPYCKTDRIKWYRDRRKKRRRRHATTTRSVTSQQARKITKVNLIGLIHINASVFLKALESTLKEISPMIGKLNVDAFTSIAKKVNVLEFYILKVGDTVVPMVAVYGKISPKDFAGFIAQVGGTKAPLKKEGNGRYILDSWRIIAAAEAKDFKGNALHVFMPLITANEVKLTLKQRPELLKTLLAKVDKKAMIWGGRKAFDKSIWPKQTTGSINLSDKGTVTLNFEYVFIGRQQASEMKKAFLVRDSMPSEFIDFLKLVKLKQSGSVVTITNNGDGVQFGELVKAGLRALNRARRMAKRVISAANLRAIGKCVAMYMAEYDDTPPPNLAILVEKKFLSVRQLLSPSSGRKKLKTDKKGVPMEKGDYVYIVLPDSATDPAIVLSDSVPTMGLVRAYERPGINNGEGVNVLYAAGNVMWCGVEQLKKDLRKTEKWLADNKP